ncbi:hypothetical protein O181_013366 [Austropuccinia psidii MF-1]|uniref:Uncharacterized protein n=1 Tax=Austropuccinia psidii MF-1 TaxID=1389203 RepID=A0A9Q3GN55_9BASI|nr:hypothetical protein [Austropuccinia psidii MF-1]
MSVNDSPLLLDKRTPQENSVISHFIHTTLPADFALCIGIMLLCVTAKEFFDAVKAQCCLGNRFQKLKVVHDLLNSLIENGSGMPKPNNTIVLTLQHSFAIFKKLGIEAEELEGLLAQALWHAQPKLDQVAFDQLITEMILSKGEERPSLTFVGQVILNASQGRLETTRLLSLLVYCMSNPPELASIYPWPRSPYQGWRIALTSNVHCPPNNLVEKFGCSCFHYAQTAPTPAVLQTPMGMLLCQKLLAP